MPRVKPRGGTWGPFPRRQANRQPLTTAAQQQHGYQRSVSRVGSLSRSWPRSGRTVRKGAARRQRVRKRAAGSGSRIQTLLTQGREEKALQDVASGRVPRFLFMMGDA